MNNVINKTENLTILTKTFAINGYGRIGRCLLRSWCENNYLQNFIVPQQINELANIDDILYLTKYDSTHGRFPYEINIDKNQNTMNIFLNNNNNNNNNKNINILISHNKIFGKNNNKNNKNNNNNTQKLNTLLDCSGQYKTRQDFENLLAASQADNIIISNPANSADDVDATIIFGFNENTLNGTEKIISAASCTTTAAVPILSLLDKHFSLKQVFITTLHSAMNDQPLLDSFHNVKESVKNRAALISMIPISTGLTKGIERFLPHLQNKIHSQAIRIPTLNVSALDITLQIKKNDLTTTILKDFLYKNTLKNVQLTEQFHASVDFNHDKNSAIIDLTQLKVSEDLIHLFIWFDNEWAYANRMLELTNYINTKK